MADEDDEIEMRVAHIEYYDIQGDGKSFADIVDEVVDLFRLHDLSVEWASDGPAEEHWTE